MAADKVSVRCCVAGGGPAGIMLGLLLARAGVEVLVLEKHADFLRDFRGDTIHPSTLEVMHELGFLEDLLKLPHQKAPRLNAQVGGLALTVADFTHLPTRCGFIAFMPQWDLLNLLAERGARYPTFKLRMRAEVIGLIEEAGRVVGLHATTSDGPLGVRVSLVVGADGRHSVVRARAGLQVDQFGAPMDRLRRWYRPGLLCIGEAAHAMSPVGGVGINLAIQDAIAAAILLAAPLCAGRLTTKDLRRVQRRREWPTRITQRFQIFVQNRVIRRVLGSTEQIAPPFAIRLVARFPLLSRIPARLIGIGFRPEHVQTPAG